MNPRLGLVRLGFGLLACATASGQITKRQSVDSSGAQGNGGSSSPSISADRRWVVFTSESTNLSAGDSNGLWDVFVRDRTNGTTECVSVDPSGAPGNGHSGMDTGSYLASADGRFVGFHSSASNLVAGDANGKADAFVRDRQTGTTELVSVDGLENRANDDSTPYSISADGRYVAFLSFATNLAPGAIGNGELYVRDRQLGTTECVSVDSSGALGNDHSQSAILTPDGRFVVFSSLATNLVAGDTNGILDIFLRDRQTSTTERISLNSFGIQANGICFWPRASADGRYVAFTSNASNLAGADSPPPFGFFDVFVRDRQTGSTELVSANLSGQVGNSHSVFASITADGRYVAFASEASDLLPILVDTNGKEDVFLRDRQTGTTQRVGLSTGGAQPNENCFIPSITGDGVCIAFQANATNLVPLDTNGMMDVFVRDLQASATTSFTSLCSPGLAGVLACPCSNPPSGPDRGCDNSSGTGGASLSASGNTELSADSLVFTASGEKPNALTVLAQGNLFLANGRVYGQGVRCPGGAIRRLYVRSAELGTVSMPLLADGEPAVCERSAQKGDVIQAGQSRWYFAFYRDPTVLGGCSPESTFNATQTGEIVWAP